MSGHDPRQAAARVSTLWRAFGELESGVMPAVEREELMSSLAGDEETRRAYLDYFEMSSLLHLEAESQDEQDKLPFVGDRRLQRRNFRWSLAAAAAVVALLGVIAALIAVREPDLHGIGFRVAPETDFRIQDGIEAEESGEWQICDGSRIRVLTGLLGFQTDCGTRLLVEGPADVGFPKLDRPVVRSGWLWIDSGDSGERFEVEAEGYVVRNVGTRFGVLVRDDKSVEVHLHRGRVEIDSSSAEIRQSRMSGKGGVLLAEGLEEVDPGRDPFPRLERMLQSASSYAVVVLGQRPTGYWRLGETAGVEVGNEIGGGNPGQYGLRLDLGAEGPALGDGFRGFGPENRAVSLHGEQEKSVIRSLDADEGISAAGGAVSFWIKRAGDIEREEVLWSATGSPTGGPGHEISVSIARDGRVVGFFENGREDIRLMTGDSLADDRWHHFVLSWEEETIGMFVDGAECGRSNGPRVDTGTVFSGINVRFGKIGVGSGQRRNLNSFRGLVDEIAIWNRSLAAGEVRMQDQAALGGPAK